MSAGLPGLGLGGLFFIFCALLSPFVELWRTLRGRSSLAAWRGVARQVAQGLAMVAAIDLSLRLARFGIGATGLGDASAADIGTVLPLTTIGVTSVLMVAVVGGAKAAELATRARRRALPGRA